MNELMRIELEWNAANQSSKLMRQIQNFWIKVFNFRKQNRKEKKDCCWSRQIKLLFKSLFEPAGN